MTKAFDTAELITRLKGKGMHIAEEAVELLVTETLDWTSESCMLHENPFVKMGAPVVAAVKPIIMAEVKKIDGDPAT